MQFKFIFILSHELTHSKVSLIILVAIKGQFDESKHSILPSE